MTASTTLTLDNLAWTECRFVKKAKVIFNAKCCLSEFDTNIIMIPASNSVYIM